MNEHEAARRLYILLTLAVAAFVSAVGLLLFWLMIGG